jgi:hypothetical protein
MSLTFSFSVRSVSYAVRVVSKESGRLVILRTSCIRIRISVIWDVTPYSLVDKCELSNCDVTIGITIC